MNKKYVRVDKKGWIKIQMDSFWKKERLKIEIYLGWQKRANTNTNTSNRTGLREYENEYEHLSHTAVHYTVRCTVPSTVWCSMPNYHHDNLWKDWFY